MLSAHSGDGRGKLLALLNRQGLTGCGSQLCVVQSWLRQLCLLGDGWDRRPDQEADAQRQTLERHRLSYTEDGLSKALLHSS